MTNGSLRVSVEFLVPITNRSRAAIAEANRLRVLVTVPHVIHLVCEGTLIHEHLPIAAFD